MRTQGKTRTGVSSVAAMAQAAAPSWPCPGERRREGSLDAAQTLVLSLLGSLLVGLGAAEPEWTQRSPGKKPPDRPGGHGPESPASTGDLRPLLSLRGWSCSRSVAPRGACRREALVMPRGGAWRGTGTPGWGLEGQVGIWPGLTPQGQDHKQLKVMGHSWADGLTAGCTPGFLVASGWGGLGLKERGLRVVASRVPL